MRVHSPVSVGHVHTWWQVRLPSHAPTRQRHGCAPRPWLRRLNDEALGGQALQHALESFERAQLDGGGQLGLGGARGQQHLGASAKHNAVVKRGFGGVGV